MGCRCLLGANWWLRRGGAWGEGQSLERKENSTGTFSPGDGKLREHGGVSWAVDSRDLEPEVVNVVGP